MVVMELSEKVEYLTKKLIRLERAFRRLKKSLIPEDKQKVRKPSGFAIPSYLSPELCSFLDIPTGTELPRTEVTKRILQYVKDENLQNPDKKKYILLDAKMKTLLNPPVDFDVTYFNIQKLLKLHYQKPNVSSKKIYRKKQ